MKITMITPTATALTMSKVCPPPAAPHEEGDEQHDRQQSVGCDIFSHLYPESHISNSSMKIVLSLPQ
jgi:hypothetical protein